MSTVAISAAKAAHDPRCAQEIRARALSAHDHGDSLIRRQHEAAREIIACCGHRPIKAFRLAFGWTVREAVERASAVHQAARGLSERSWLGWEAGGGISRDYQDVICQLFRTGPVQLGLATDYSAAAGAEPGRNSGGGLPRGEAIGVEVEMAASESARFDAFAEQSNVGPHTLEQFRDDLQRIVTVYPHRPVYPLFMELRGLRDRAFGLLEGRQPPGHTRELYLVTGYLCGVLANASFDLGHFTAAQTQARTAFLCAELAGHNGLRAWTRGMQALVAYWDDRPADCVALTVDGAQYEPESGTSTVRLHALQARAHARLGDRHLTLAALERAERARDQVVPPDAPEGMLGFPQAKQDCAASTAWLWLGDPEAIDLAGRHAQQAVAGYEADPPQHRRLGELSLARLDLAAAHMAGTNLDGAAHEIRSVLHTAAGRTTDSVTRRLRQVAASLEQPVFRGSRDAAELRHLITAHTDHTALPAVIVQEPQ